MILFNNDNFKNSDVNYLLFDNEFSIKVNNEKIKIILGPNGIGKSSIYRDIQEKHPEYSFIDYGEVEQDLIKCKNILIIASKIATIEEKQKEKSVLIATLNLDRSFKDFNLTSKSKCETISSNLYNYKTDLNLAVSNYSDEKLDVLLNLDDDLQKFIIKYGKNLIEQTIEEAKLDEIKDSYKKKILELTDNYLSDDDNVCPVCRTVFKIPIKNIIKESLSKIKESTNDIVNDYISNNQDITPDMVLEKVNKLKQTITENKITTSVLENYIICGGSKEKSNLINSNKEKINILNEEISDLEDKKTEFYLNIKKIETRIRSVFENQLGIESENIMFDDDNKELHIKLSRNIIKYSTGEINLITFIVSLLEFINSDKDTLVIDDPLSSYDIPNQYKIMYEITNVNSAKKFNILILTHNIDCINIANSQYSNAYSIELLDKISNKLYIKSLDNFGDSGYNVYYLIDKLEKENSYSYIEYIKLLKEKDNWDSKDPKHQLFHYDGEYKVPNKTCNNNELVDIIDKLDCNDITNGDAIVNSANKIIYLAALRVWIEKQFYDNTDNKEGLKDKKLLGRKINYMIDEHHWKGEANIKKDFLMSKKVMLNQNEHVNSQKEPFYYALSMSTDDIIRDIIEIKSHFGK